jgi:hypothetical protein
MPLALCLGHSGSNTDDQYFDGLSVIVFTGVRVAHADV